MHLARSYLVSPNRRFDTPLFRKVETPRWRGPTPAFTKWAKKMKALRLLERCKKAAERL
jgi:hypothetical protein